MDSPRQPPQEASPSSVSAGVRYSRHEGAPRAAPVAQPGQETMSGGCGAPVLAIILGLKGLVVIVLSAVALAGSHWLSPDLAGAMLSPGIISGPARIDNAGLWWACYRNPSDELRVVVAQADEDAATARGDSSPVSGVSEQEIERLVTVGDELRRILEDAPRWCSSNVGTAYELLPDGDDVWARVQAARVLAAVATGCAALATLVLCISAVAADRAALQAWGGSVATKEGQVAPEPDVEGQALTSTSEAAAMMPPGSQAANPAGAALATTAASSHGKPAFAFGRPRSMATFRNAWFAGTMFLLTYVLCAVATLGLWVSIYEDAGSGASGLARPVIWIGWCFWVWIGGIGASLPWITIVLAMPCLRLRGA
ncbi:unnamed protein product [Pedinophyceae sp. YPF-701]|nr:unnamed protein product [Pedinophyceae sp. YPF-701]